jgi:hypothetical protein
MRAGFNYKIAQLPDFPHGDSALVLRYIQYLLNPQLLCYNFLYSSNA